MIHVKWLGAAGLEFTCNGSSILIDPYLSRPRKKDLFFKHPRPDKNAIRGYMNHLPGTLTGIIVGHTHFDHALDIP